MGKVSKNILLNDVEIIDTSVEGKSVAKHEGMVIFCEGGVPGDIVDLDVYKKKSKLAEAKVVAIKSPSPNRVIPECPHFGVCGGCKWQNMSYSSQLHYKQKFVSDALVRIGKLDIPEISPVFGNNESFFLQKQIRVFVFK
jgi:23S rRNA (uracil1939-C5)-methyltransferase